MERTGEDGRRWTVGAWLRESDAGEERSRPILGEAALDAATGLFRRALDRDEAVGEAVARALEDDAAPLRRAKPGTPLAGWFRGVLLHIRQERWREREKEKEKEALVRPEDIADPRAGPADTVELEDDLRLDRSIIEMALPDLSSPHGSVLYLQVVRGLSHAEIHEVLGRIRPLGRERVDQLVREAHAEFRAWLVGKAPRK